MNYCCLCYLVHYGAIFRGHKRCVCYIVGTVKYGEYNVTIILSPYDSLLICQDMLLISFKLLIRAAGKSLCNSGGQ